MRILQTVHFVRDVTKTILGFSLVPKSHLAPLFMTLYHVTAPSPVSHNNINFLSFSRFPFCVTGVNNPQSNKSENFMSTCPSQFLTPHALICH